MDPFRFNRVEPWTSTRQRADHKTDTDRRTLFDLLIVLAYPALHGSAAVPGGVVPDQQQGGEALCREASGTPRQKRDGDGTDGAPRDKPEPHVVGLGQPWPHQQAITSQGFRSRIVRRWGQLLQLGRVLSLGPAALVRLGQAAPPDFVAKPQRPRGVGQGPLDEVVAPFFFRR
jgi:hypothetical protein